MRCAFETHQDDYGYSGGSGGDAGIERRTRNAEELDGFFIDEGFSGDEFIFVDEGTTLDELCSPGLSDGIFIPGCIFSDPIEADDADAEEVVFFVADNDFDFNDDFNHDNDDNDFDFNDNSRSGDFVG